ncbi:hypothetical protein Scep_014892 [Stephania cephalantha]|uniref:Uncharacterized protein n=1 Tax=Stephania cephalantha TaxID=152367 RepID=A0AAP0J4Q0_9MAGN
MLQFLHLLMEQEKLEVDVKLLKFAQTSAKEDLKDFVVLEVWVALFAMVF